MNNASLLHARHYEGSRTTLLSVMTSRMQTSWHAPDIGTSILPSILCSGVYDSKTQLYQSSDCATDFRQWLVNKCIETLIMASEYVQKRECSKELMLLVAS
jgi:hypothetical protein